MVSDFCFLQEWDIRRHDEAVKMFQKYGPIHRKQKKKNFSLVFDELAIWLKNLLFLQIGPLNWYWFFFFSGYFYGV